MMAAMSAIGTPFLARPAANASSPISLTKPLCTNSPPMRQRASNHTMLPAVSDRSRSTAWTGWRTDAENSCFERSSIGRCLVIGSAAIFSASHGDNAPARVQAASQNIEQQKQRREKIVTDGTRGHESTAFALLSPDYPPSRATGSSGLVPVILDSEQRERAQDVRRIGRRRRMQVGAIELGESDHAEQAEAPLHLILQQFEQAQHARRPASRERKALHAADADQIGSRGDRLHDVGTTANRAVDEDFRPAGNGLDDFRQHVHCAASVIELAPSVVRHVYPLDAMFDSDAHVLGAGDALDRQRDLKFALDALDRAPIEAGLES